MTRNTTYLITRAGQVGEHTEGVNQVNELQKNASRLSLEQNPQILSERFGTFSNVCHTYLRSLPEIVKRKGVAGWPESRAVSTLLEGQFQKPPCLLNASAVPQGGWIVRATSSEWHNHPEMNGTVCQTKSSL